MKLQNKLRKLRKDRGWSQAELGQRVEVHSGHISRLETGRFQPSADLLKKLAGIFEVTVDYLLNEEEGEFSPVSIEDKALAERVRLIQTLDAEEQSALIKIIDALLTKKKITDLVAKETGLVAS